MKLTLTIVLVLFMFSLGFSQDQSNAQQIDRKGRLYFYWGWNWAWYSKSDIQFTGLNYDFTLDKVSAQDRQTKFSAYYYLNPMHITIPQYNLRIGYFITDNYSISIGIDHMKYVVNAGQTVKISGNINDSGTVFDGIYNNDEIVITDDFLQFEHTDGLNYINIDFRRFDQIFDLHKVTINITEGLGTGIVYPKTNATLLNNERHDEFHVAGYGINAVVGINVELYRSFFVQTEFKGGYINMPDIQTTNYSTDKASQSFFFYQLNVTLGASINLRKKKQATNTE